MRKIEKKIVEAVRVRKSAIINNTATLYDETDNVSKVYLFGNHIGSFLYYSGVFLPNTQTLRKYPTKTTMSRLRAFGVDVGTKKGEVYLNSTKL